MIKRPQTGFLHSRVILSKYQETSAACFKTHAHIFFFFDVGEESAFQTFHKMLTLKESSLMAFEANCDLSQLMLLLTN